MYIFFDGIAVSLEPSLTSKLRKPFNSVVSSDIKVLILAKSRWLYDFEPPPDEIEAEAYPFSAISLRTLLSSVMSASISTTRVSIFRFYAIVISIMLRC